MAETYDIVCDTCRVRLWIGQSRYGQPETFRIYDSLDGSQQPLAKFLMAHEAHRLRFFSDNNPLDDTEDYAAADGCDDPQS